jgi:hypothetical protein
MRLFINIIFSTSYRDLPSRYGLTGHCFKHLRTGAGYNYMPLNLSKDLDNSAKLDTYTHSVPQIIIIYKVTQNIGKARGPKDLSNMYLLLYV